MFGGEEFTVLPVIARYRFDFFAIDPVGLPQFAGSAMRGVFGHSLKDTVCVTRQKQCSDCPLRQQCVYTQLFETGLFVDSATATQPLIIDSHGLQRNYASREGFAIELTLMGVAIAHLPSVIHAWRRAGQRGLGKQQARFRLRALSQLDMDSMSWRLLLNEGEDEPVLPVMPTVPAMSGQGVKIKLSTPYRSKLGGHLLKPQDFSAQGFLASLVHRIANLQALHCPDQPTLDIEALLRATAACEMSEVSLQWQKWQRFSSRQKTHMQLDGIVGEFSLRGGGLNVLAPLLTLGQWLHAGKNTLFGLGRYRLRSNNV